MKKRFAGIVSLAAAVALVVTGCSTTDGGSAGGDDSIEIGIVTFSATDVAVNNLVTGAQEKAEELGYVTSVVDANGAVDQANTAMENLVQKGVDAIFVTVFPSTALASGLAAAKGADIPVLVLGGGLEDGVALSVDDALGTPVSEYLVEQLTDEADILQLNYRSGRPCQLREEAFDEVTAGLAYSVNKQEITIPGQVETSRAATIAWLAGTKVVPGSTAVWTCFDDSAMGAISALKEQGLNPGDVIVTGTNGTKEALQAVQEGWLTVTLWINHKGAGVEMVEYLADILEAGDSWEPKVIPATHEIVDASNVDEFIETHPEIAG